MLVDLAVAIFFICVFPLLCVHTDWAAPAVSTTGLGDRDSLPLTLSQTDLAARMQIRGVIIERDSISRIEIGTRFVPDYELPIFAQVLGVSVLWLLGMSE